MYSHSFVFKVSQSKDTSQVKAQQSYLNQLQNDHKIQYLNSKASSKSTLDLSSQAWIPSTKMFVSNIIQSHLKVHQCISQLQINQF